MSPWTSLGENQWTTFGENRWTSLGENGWPRLGENTWTIIARKMTAELKAKAEAGEIRTIQDGVDWAKTHDVAYTYWGMRGVFGRLGLKKKVPRPKSPQTSDEEQEAWKKGDFEIN